MRSRPVPIVGLALVSETGLALLGLLWMRLRGLPLVVGPPSGLAIGLGLAGVLALANHALLHRAPDVAPVRSIRTLYRTVLEPLFADLSTAQILIVSAAAGIGEEIFFRGALQQDWGLVPASVIFGALHVAGRTSLAFGAWAAVLGAVLGGSLLLTGGLLAPIVAHVAYDAAALVYIRWNRG